MTNDNDIIKMESMFRLGIVIGIAVTLPMKLALEELARRKRVPISVMVRNMFIDYFMEREPEFREIYSRHLREQADRIKERVSDD